MSRSRELLALRKQLLVTQASVQRLRLAQQLGALREELRLPNVARSVAGSTRMRAALLTLLLMALGGRKAGRWVRRATLVMSMAGMVRSLLRPDKRAAR